MRRSMAALCAALIFLLIPLSASAQAENLVRNPGFDEIGSSNLPENWYPDMWYTEDGVSRLTTGQDGYEGACAQVRNMTENDARFAQDVAVEPDSLYEITAMVRAEGVAGEADGKIGANISVRDTFSYSDSVYDTNGEWVKLTLYGKTGADQTELTLLARVGGYSSLNTGTAWFDSFTMTKIDAVPAGVATKDFAAISASPKADEDDGAPSRNTEAWLLAAFGIALVAVALMRKSGRAPLQNAKRYELWFALILLASVAARLYIGARVYGYHTDINCFTAWSERIYSVGYTNFYRADYFCDYPPLYMAMLWFVAGVRNLLGIAYGSDAHVLLIKLIPVFADAVMAYLVYFFAKKRVNPRAAMLLGAVCALNPAAIVDSAAWGQIDSVFTIFLALCAALLCEGAYGWALPMFTFSMLLKPQALLFAPLGLVAVVVSLARKPEKKKILGAAYGLAASLVLLLLAGFIFHEDGVGPVKWLFTLYGGTMGSYEYFTINALNLYELLGLNWVALSDNLALAVFAYVLFGLSYLYAFALYIRANKRSAIFMAGAVLIMLICAFGPMIHERYAYPALVLLVLAYAVERDRRILYSLAALTITLFLNQILVLQGGMTEANFGHLQSSEDWLNAPLSLLAVGNAAYAAYVAFSMYFMEKRVELDQRPLDGPSPAWEGLFGRRDYRLNLKRWDYLVLAGVTVAYSVMTFVNLGATSAPESSWISSQDGEQIVFDLGAPETFRMEYYGGICNTNFTVELSNDGAAWTEPQFAAYNQGQIFRWLFYSPVNDDAKQTTLYGETVPTTDGSAYTVFATASDKYPYQTARYVRVTARYEGLILSEIGFLNADGKTLPATVASGDGAALLDERKTVPAHPSYYNSTYFDEIYHARTAYEHLHGLHTYEWTHPPLGKVLMMVGVDLFGMTPFGWRFMGALMGVLMLPVLYLMVKQLGGSRKIAALAMLLFALDSMHFTQTRIATIDSYAVFFIMLMYLFMFRYVRMSFHRQPLWKTLIPLMLCGVTMGVAWATKWIGIYASAGLAILFFWSLLSRYREHLEAVKREDDQFESDDERRAALEARDHFFRNAAITLLVCCAFFLAIPALIYYLSYYWQLTPDGDFTVKRVIELQKQMYNYHKGLKNDDHYFRSPWYQWPVIAWPMWFYDGKSYLPSGMISSISCMGNPAVWWTGFVAMVWTIVETAWKRRASVVGVILTIGFLSQYLPWTLVPRSMFIYHYFASVPFIIIATAFLLGRLEEKRPKAFLWSALLLVAAAAALFILFYPLESGMPVAISYAKHLRWFDWYNY